MASRDVRWKDVVNAGLHRATRAGLRARLAAQSRLGLTTPYQPDPFAAGTEDGLRSSAQRFEAFAPSLPDGPISVLDIGCNEGYFVFRMAERGGTCIGIDGDRNAVMVAEARAKLQLVPNALFANFPVEHSNVEGLPRFDVVILLSVFHHWVRHQGRESAEDLFAGLASHAGRYMVFETGQPDEDSRWANELAFMEPDFRSYVKGLFTSTGFSDVRELGSFPTTVSATPRVLWLATR